MGMREDLEEAEEFIQAGENLAERYRPAREQDINEPIADLGFKAFFTSWRTRALKFVHLQTGANSVYAQAFSRNCGPEGSYGDIVAGLTELEKVKRGIMEGEFEGKRQGHFS